MAIFGMKVLVRSLKKGGRVLVAAADVANSLHDSLPVNLRWSHGRFRAGSSAVPGPVPRPAPQFRGRFRGQSRSSALEVRGAVPQFPCPLEFEFEFELEARKRI